MKKLFNIAKKALLLFSCGLPALQGLYQLRCNDIWLHLKTGAWIWSHHTVPHTQLYSFWIGPKEWIDHEWLFQAIIYPIFYLMGLNGLIIFQFFLVSIILGLFFILAKKSNRYFIFSCLTIAIAGTVASFRFFIRPEIFSLLFVALFIFLLKSYQGKNLIFLLLPLQIFWSNIHGYYILGPILVGLFILSKAIEAKVKLPFSWNENRLKINSLLKLIILFLLLVIATLATPYFLKGALYPFRILGSMLSDSLEGRYVTSFVAELQGIPILHIIDRQRLALLSATIIAYLLSLLLNIRKIDIFDLAVFALFLGLTIKANRHIGILALSSGMLALFNFNQAEYNRILVKERTQRLFRVVFEKIIPALVLVILIANLFIIINYSLAMTRAKYIYNLKGQAKGFLFGKDESIRIYPVGAAVFITENKIRGNIFNFFNHGAYLIFSLYPDCKVFIDGRTELYGDTLLKAADRILLKPQLLDKISENLSIEGVIWPCSQNPRISAVFKYLYKHKDWKLVFFDGGSSVFLKNLPKYRELIKKRRVVLEDFDIKPDRGLIEIAKEKRFAATLFFDTASFFYHIDIPEQALAAIEVAKEIYPEDYQVCNLKAVLLARLGRDKQALDEFLEAARISPTHPTTFKNMGVFYLERGQPKIAKECFRKGLELNPGNKELTDCLKEIDKYIKE